MNKQKIIAQINKPELLGKEDFSALKLLSEKYPYSGLLQALYAKALHNDNSIYFEEQLKKTAITNSNRKKLYQLIHQTKLKRVIEKIEEQTSKNTTEDLNKLKNKEEVSELKTEQESNNESIHTKEIQKIDELEQNILNEAINSSIHLDVSNEIPSLDELIKKESIKDIPKKEKKNIEVKKSSFTSWFTGRKTSSKGDEKTISLVDKFTSKDTINKEKKDFFSPTNLAKMSLVDNEDFVTETLAKVYASQGNFDKAIRIYERLILNYPEKKTFFASRIRFLKEKKES